LYQLDLTFCNDGAFKTGCVAFPNLEVLTFECHGFNPNDLRELPLKYLPKLREIRWRDSSKWLDSTNGRLAIDFVSLV
jgi:hypothetical protein